MKKSLSLLCLTAIFFLSACATTTGAMNKRNCGCKDASVCTDNHCPSMKQDDGKNDCGTP